MTDQIPSWSQPQPHLSQQQHSPTMPPLPPGRSSGANAIIIIAIVFGGIVLLGIIAAVVIPSVLNRHRGAGPGASDLVVEGNHAWVTKPDRGTIVQVSLADSRRTGEVVFTGGGPIGIASAPGSVWVVGNAANDVRHFDPVTGQLQGGPIPVGMFPFSVAIESGSAWVTNSVTNNVTRISLETNAIVGRPIPVGRQPRAIAAGHGAVWVGNSRSDTVSRIVADGRRSHTKEFSVGGEVNDVTVTAGAVWLAEPGVHKVVRLDPRTGRVLKRIDTGGDVGSIAAGGGYIWAANQRSGDVFQIDARTNRTVGSVRSVDGQVSDIEYSDRGAWVLQTNGRIDRVGEPVTVRPEPQPPTQPDPESEPGPSSGPDSSSIS